MMLKPVTANSTSEPALSIIVPTRDRAEYLRAAIRSCLLSTRQDYEVVILDNASTDDTQAVVASFSDTRLRYQRSATRLSMRDNFERGLDHARGKIVGFIGDDDGIFDFTPEKVLALFKEHRIDAVSAARAHYGWPDLRSARRNTGLLPRGSETMIRQSRQALRGLLRHSDYYRLPCIYHGFVRASVLQRVQQQQGRLFLSSQVDMFSAIALSMEDISFAYCESPLVINGGSSRSNGASHFGGGSSVEKTNWKKEDDLGFLPGFADHATVGSLIVESAIRYCHHHPDTRLSDIFDSNDVRATLRREHDQRVAFGRPLTDYDQTWIAAGLDDRPDAAPPPAPSVAKRLRHLGKAFGAMRPIDMQARKIEDVAQASELFSSQLSAQATGYLVSAVEQLRVSARLALVRGQ